MLPSGININKKQMKLCGVQLPINQAPRPLMANTAQVGRGKTFSWPPPGLISQPPFLALPPRIRPSSKSLWSKSGLARGCSPHCGTPGQLRGTFWRFPGTKGFKWPSTQPCSIPGSAVLRQLVGACCSLFLWRTPSGIGIFNWKLIWRLNRRSRQRQVPTHLHSSTLPPHLGEDVERAWLSCILMGAATSITLREHTLIFLKVVNLVRISSCLLSSTS